METLYIVLIAILFILAISDLVVGVSNDAVNFLVSAIGSKAAPFWVIMLVASAGIVVGATFSSGMMEVARKGIFHPQLFFFSEIMVIYLAVMLTDIILLDLFNTFGMPTSTTVSIVFELLGAAVAVSVIKVSADETTNISDYINSAKALAIISGILLSVVVAFSVGAFVQYITRIVFSFKTDKTIKRYGAIWGGIAITAIVYFMLIKGLKGTPYGSYVMGNGEELKAWVQHNVLLISTVNFLFWTAVLQVLHWTFKINILKVVVLAGTFALAMAFAGNDLVNFIGVPLAGFAAFKLWLTETTANGTLADAFSMGSFTGKIATPVLYLLTAGAIMVATLWFSKKSRSVTKTSLDLSRQDEGNERFGSSALSRSIVRSSIAFGNSLSLIIPQVVLTKLNSRFETVKQTENSEENVDFDLIRASVNLMVASILISLATSFKLPLSTTYVTFMVAMGTSLADGAWGRESAVYRITGVVSVIGGWFFTAFIAFTVAFIFAFIISLSLYMVFAILGLALFLIFKTKSVHENSETTDALEDDSDISDINLFEKSSDKIVIILRAVVKLYFNTIKGVTSENHRSLKKDIAEIEVLNIKTKRLKDRVAQTVVKLQDNSIETGHFYVQAVDYLREIVHSINFIVTPAYEHVANNHKGFIEDQNTELNTIKEKILNISNRIIQIIKENNFEAVDDIILQQTEILDIIKKARKAQIKRIKAGNVGTRNSMLYLNILAETKNLLLYVINLLKSQRDFITNNEC